MLARVYGPAPFRQDVLRTLGEAGVETTAPGDLSGLALREPTEPGVVDVVCMNDGSDGLVVLAKRAQVRRPVLGVLGDERAARVALGASWGPDACVVWPATPEILARGVADALRLAPRPAYLRWPRVLELLSLPLLLALMAVGVLGAGTSVARLLTQALLALLVSAIWFVRSRYAASRWPVLAGALLFLVAAALGVSVVAVRLAAS